MVPCVCLLNSVTHTNMRWCRAVIVSIEMREKKSIQYFLKCAISALFPKMVTKRTFWMTTVRKAVPRAPAPRLTKTSCYMALMCWRSWKRLGAAQLLPLRRGNFGEGFFAIFIIWGWCWEKSYIQGVQSVCWSMQLVYLLTCSIEYLSNCEQDMSVHFEFSVLWRYF